MENNIQYRAAYEANLHGLIKALGELDKLENKITAYRRTLSSLADLCRDSGEDISDLQHKHAALLKHVEGSLTDEIRKIVKASPNPVTTQDVRHALRMLNYDLSEHSNPMAAINAILNRLADGKEVKEVKSGNRKAWKRVSVFYGEM